MPDELRINFVGDLCFQGVSTTIPGIAPGVHAFFASGDINVANLEAPLTHCQSRTAHQPCYLRGEPESSPLFELFDTYSLANNHILDYTAEGLEETLSFLSDQGKSWFGGGLTEADAWCPLRLEKKGIRLGFIGFTRWYNARGRRPGTTPARMRRLCQIVEELKSEGRFVVVYPHWNYEYLEYPSPIDRQRAHRLIDAGADLIVGSHPHVVQGAETYAGKSIFHSLGNFLFLIFDLADRRFATSAALSVTVQPDHSYTTEVVPTMTTPETVSLLEGTERTEFLDHFDRLSRVLEDERQARQRFYAAAARIVADTMNSLEATSSRAIAWLGLLRRIPRIQRQDIYIKLHAMFGRKRAPGA